jgi:hypothetical protein
MNDKRLQTIEQVEQFLTGSEALDFGGVSVWEIVYINFQSNER